MADNGGINRKEILSILADKKGKGEKIRYVAGEVGVLADRVDEVIDGQQEERACRESIGRSVTHLETTTFALQQQLRDITGKGLDLSPDSKRRVALLENRADALEKVNQILRADVEALQKDRDRIRHDNFALATALKALEGKVVQLTEGVGKDQKAVQGTWPPAWMREAFATAAIDPRLAKYLEDGGKYLTVEPITFGGGREWKAAVFRETENDDGADEYGNAYAASPCEAVAALVAKLVKHKEL